MFRHYHIIFRELLLITVPGKHDSNVNIQIVCSATTLIDFVRIVTIMTLPHFISNWTILMF